jgi:site-specific DNA recombinase
LPGIAPAIVTPQEAATVAQRLATNKAHATRNNRNPEAALLRAGFVKCGHCGWAMSVQNARRGETNRSAS